MLAGMSPLLSVDVAYSGAFMATFLLVFFAEPILCMYVVSSMPIEYPTLSIGI